MTTTNDTTTPTNTNDANTNVPPSAGSSTQQPHYKGHRRQESMYAMTGLYSETIPEQSEVDQNKCPTNFYQETIIKCHSRNPSASFDRDKAAQNASSYHEAPVILKDLQDCGIFRFRPGCLQKYASIKVRNQHSNVLSSGQKCFVSCLFIPKFSGVERARAGSVSRARDGLACRMSLTPKFFFTVA